MSTVKTTRRSFFGWLGALLAMPFVGKVAPKPKRPRTALWFDGTSDFIVIDRSGNGHHGLCINWAAEAAGD
jgi:hypothetical protein